MGLEKETLTAALDSLEEGIAIASTTTVFGEPVGTIVGSVREITHSPPTVVISIENDNHALQELLASNSFALSVLTHEQFNIARRFGHRTEWPTVAYRPGREGNPLLRNALATLECRVRNSISQDGRQLVSGEILHAAVRPSRSRQPKKASSLVRRGNLVGNSG